MTDEKRLEEIEDACEGNHYVSRTNLEGKHIAAKDDMKWLCSRLRALTALPEDVQKVVDAAKVEYKRLAILEEADAIGKALDLASSSVRRVEELERENGELKARCEKLDKVADRSDLLWKFIESTGEPLDGFRFREVALELKEALAALEAPDAQ